MASGRWRIPFSRASSGPTPLATGPLLLRLFWLAALILIAEQATKLTVRMTMFEGESIPLLGQFFQFTYTQNPGMAFGLTLGSKAFLTIFSVVASIAIAAYLWHVRRAPVGYRAGLALILGGAAGNAIDRVAYGAIWGECYPSPPGSERWLYGCVVDFLHLTVWQGDVGGRYISLFPIGNIADVAILAGLALVLLTQASFQRYLHAAAPVAASPAVHTPTVDAPVTPDEPGDAPSA